MIERREYPTSGAPFAISMLMWPHVSPSTTIGAPAAEMTPTLRPASASTPASDPASVELDCRVGCAGSSRGPSRVA